MTAWLSQSSFQFGVGFEYNPQGILQSRQTDYQMILQFVFLHMTMKVRAKFIN